MRATVGVVAIGSTGDVLPHLGVARALTDEGHEVVVATHESYRSHVTALGPAFHSLPMEPEEELTEERAARMRRGPTEAAAVVGEVFSPWARRLAFAVDEFTAGCDIVLLSTMAWPGIHSAMGRGIPSISLHLQPLEPTREFPPSVLAGRPLPRLANRALGAHVQRLMHRPHMAVVNEVRGAHGLAPMTERDHVRWLAETDHPGLHGWSPRVAARPRDWRGGLRVVGYWWPPSSTWSPSGELEDFLASGPPPVYIGFGSSSPAAPETLATVVRDALRESGTRAVVLAGWGGLAGRGELEGDDVIVVRRVAHDWLLPRVSAAVHHAGCGTSAAAIRAGVPSVPVPVSLDQPFWADRLHRIGVGTAPIPARRLSGSALGAAIRRATSDEAMAGRARVLAEQVRGERGDRAVVDAVRLALDAGTGKAR
ncbi:glycosyltransferase [Intrasporangium sp.]|uniref:glycosyltransferase n=1 Tax=Intrasporangium sp. TaxID=1925024 RepID=UPI0029397A10|nr:glycosyltransferase [Intrasporangium sp.]MDV3220442.1 glycosyltransferase [Intrasporangium sp.]